MSSEPEFKVLLEKYINGEATPTECELVERWFHLIGEDDQPAQFLSAAEKERLFQVMEQSQRFRYAASVSTRPASGAPVSGTSMSPVPVPAAPLSGLPHRGLHVLLRPSWRAAAIWGGLVLLGWAGYKVSRSPHNNGTSGETAMEEIRTGQGQVKKILLPDSSEIWLNANTRLEYAADFEHDRRIRLTGEALFHVTKDERHPFTIETGDGLNTRVLGTQFDIESYAQLSVTTVAVLSGKVQVNRMDSVLGVLTRQQSISYDRNTHQFEKKAIDNIDQFAGWVSGKWAFDNKSVADLELLLRNQFGINLVNRRPDLEKSRISINFNAKQTPEEIVSLFCTFLDCHYRWKGAATIELY
jgi:transmembrane sensor